MGHFAPDTSASGETTSDEKKPHHHDGDAVFLIIRVYKNTLRYKSGGTDGARTRDPLRDRQV
uniref:hypothetical protein n=1 Tax=Hafnia alvei TaxID=569 RepID=UPI0026EA1BAE